MGIKGKERDTGPEGWETHHGAAILLRLPSQQYYLPFDDLVIDLSLGLQKLD